MAYGVLRDPDSKMVMPGICRTKGKAELIPLLQSFLKQNFPGITPPSKSTFYRFFEKLPAKSMKQMRGKYIWSQLIT